MDFSDPQFMACKARVDEYIATVAARTTFEKRSQFLSIMFNWFMAGAKSKAELRWKVREFFREENKEDLADAFDELFRNPPGPDDALSRRLLVIVDGEVVHRG